MLYFLRSTWGIMTRYFIVFKPYVYDTVMRFSSSVDMEAGDEYICCCCAQ